MIPEHLPGGRFLEPTQAVQDKTSSTMKHKKSPEFIFGQLDSLVSYRPNASVIANEAYLMCAYKKTSEWLKNLPDDEKEKAIEVSRKGEREVRKNFKKRLRTIEEKRIQAQQRQQEELQRLEKERLRKAEDMTNEKGQSVSDSNPPPEDIGHNKRTNKAPNSPNVKRKGEVRWGELVV